MQFFIQIINHQALASVSKFFRLHFNKFDGNNTVEGEDEGGKQWFDTFKYLPKVNCCDFGDMLQLIFPEHKRRHEWHCNKKGGLTGVKIHRNKEHFHSD